MLQELLIEDHFDNCWDSDHTPETSPQKTTEEEQLEPTALLTEESKKIEPTSLEPFEASF